MSVVARVIDELRDDNRTLLACSLVSKEWLPLAWRTFFRTLTVNSEARAMRLYQLLTRNPLLVQYVQALVISAGDQREKTKDLQGWITTYLPHLAEKLPHVDSLLFEGVQWNRIEYGPDFLRKLALFRGVRNLEFRGCKFQTFGDFEAVVLGFGASVNRLTLASMKWVQPVALPASYQLPLETLRVISGCSLEMVHAWLTRLQAGRQRGLLKNLELYEVPDAELVHLGRILRGMGHNLQSLKLGVQLRVEGRLLDLERQGKFYTYPLASLLIIYSPDVRRWISLQGNSGLRYLTIRVITTVPEQVHWIKNFLCLVSEDNLHILTFEVWLGLPWQLSNNVWNDIANLVSEAPQFQSLQQVRFIHRGSLDIDEVKNAIQRQFPLLHSRGKLVIENWRNMALCKRSLSSGTMITLIPFLAVV